MSNFWTLVKYEHKKLLGKKSVLAACGVVAVLMLFTGLSTALVTISSTYYVPEGMSSYEAIQYNKEMALDLAGQEIDEALILEVSAAYDKLPLSDVSSDGSDYSEIQASEEYAQYVLPYDVVADVIGYVYGSNLAGITPDEASNFYEHAQENRALSVQENGLYSAEETERILSLEEGIDTPFEVEYTEGFSRFFALSTTAIIMISLLILFIVSPLFSCEQKDRTDALVLSARKGKSSLLFAKIATAVSVSVLVWMGVLLVEVGALVSIYGFEGAQGAIQLIYPWVTYNFTMLDAAIILVATTLFAAVFQAAICAVLSAASKNPLIPMLVGFGLILAGSLNAPTQFLLLAKLRLFLPQAMGTFWDVIGTQLSWSVFGTTIWLYQAVCIVAALGSILLLALSYRIFKNHQVG